MKRIFVKLVCLPVVAVFVLLGVVAAVASAQSSSLFDNSDRQRSMTLAKYSWTYEAPLPRKEIGLHDLITVIIDEQSVVISEGEMDRKKKAHGDLILKDWVLLKGLFAYPDPQTLGDPHISGKMDNKMRSEASMETRDSMKFRITCSVVDVRPNGNLIIEGHDTIKYNCEVWNYSLTGEVRPEDVLPNNTVMSEDVANKRIHKRETGHVRDGYRRGWLLKILDKWQPF